MNKIPELPHHLPYGIFCAPNLEWIFQGDSKNPIQNNLNGRLMYCKSLLFNFQHPSNYVIDLIPIRSWIIMDLNSFNLIDDGYRTEEVIPKHICFKEIPMCTGFDTEYTFYNDETQYEELRSGDGAYSPFNACKIFIIFDTPWSDNSMYVKYFNESDKYNMDEYKKILIVKDNSNNPFTKQDFFHNHFPIKIKPIHGSDNK